MLQPALGLCSSLYGRPAAVCRRLPAHPARRVLRFLRRHVGPPARREQPDRQGDGLAGRCHHLRPCPGHGRRLVSAPRGGLVGAPQSADGRLLRSPAGQVQPRRAADHQFPRSGHTAQCHLLGLTHGFSACRRLRPLVARHRACRLQLPELLASRERDTFLLTQVS